MNFFQRLFGKSQNNDTALAVPSEALFTEQTPPADDIINAAFQPDPEPAPAVKGFVYTRPTAIRAFLDMDYRNQGEQDALLNPTAEMRDSKLTALGARFRFILSHAHEQFEAQIVQLRQSIILAEGISPVVEKQQQLRLQQLLDMQQKLDHQAALSIDGEGWIAPVLADYREGFISGTMRHLRENEILDGLNTLT
ncbi:MAG TPA: hypothetical protein VK907_11505 [Phnomibacter sp.]|nr:hypothetical protein [Phnomibacter sp.]